MSPARLATAARRRAERCPERRDGLIERRPMLDGSRMLVVETKPWPVNWSTACLEPEVDPMDAGRQLHTAGASASGERAHDEPEFGQDDTGPLSGGAPSRLGADSGSNLTCLHARRSPRPS